MVLITHNTDFGDAFEREGDDPRYFYTFSVEGYAFGINALLYAMTPLGSRVPASSREPSRIASRILLGAGSCELEASRGPTGSF